jgi:hypothetical protein
MGADFVVSANVQAEDGAVVPLESGNRYAALFETLLYIANSTRTYIAHAVGVLSRYRETPTTSHWNEACVFCDILKTLRIGSFTWVVRV